eukprot:4966828-Amphidinium_carterae.1
MGCVRLPAIRRRRLRIDAQSMLPSHSAERIRESAHRPTEKMGELFGSCHCSRSWGIRMQLVNMEKKTAPLLLNAGGDGTPVLLGYGHSHFIFVKYACRSDQT